MTTTQLEALTHTPTLAVLAVIAWTIYGLTVWNQNRTRYKRKGN